MDNISLKINSLKKKYPQTRKHSLFFLLVTLLLAIVLIMTTTDTYSASAIKLNSNKLTVQEVTIKDLDGNAIALGEKSSFDLDSPDISQDLTSGEVGASQSVLFETDGDRDKGIIKNNVDVSAKAMTNSMDVVFVLDASGSMAQTLGSSAPAPNEDIGPPDLLDYEGTRFGLAQQSILKLSEKLLSEDGSNRVSVVAFSSQVDDSLDLNNDFSSVGNFLSKLRLGQNTNYESGFKEAEKLLNLRTEAEKGRETHVILITDGQPNRGNSLAGANSLKDNTSAELYCVGLQSGANDLFRSLVKDDSYFTDCNNEDEFVQYFNELGQNLSVKQSANIYSDLGENVSLLCNESYPISIGEDVYSSPSDLPKSLFVFNQEDNGFQWDIPSIREGGIRLTYYTKLTEKAKDNLSNGKLLNLNDSTNLEFFQQYKDAEGTVKTADQATTKILDPYTISGQKSDLIIKIFSNKMEGEDSLLGKTLKYGDKIKYTIQLENRGQLSLKNIVIGADIPHGTEYKPTSALIADHENQTVSSKPFTLSPGESREISFNVLIDIKEGNISNSGFLSLDLQKGSTEYVRTPELKNPVALFSPTPTLPSNPPSTPIGDPSVDVEKPVLTERTEASPQEQILGNNKGGQFEPPVKAEVSAGNFAEPSPALLGQPLQDKSATGSSSSLDYLLIALTIAILSTILIVQGKGIASDLRVLAWYKKKKNESGRASI